MFEDGLTEMRETAGAYLSSAGETASRLGDVFTARIGDLPAMLSAYGDEIAGLAARHPLIAALGAAAIFATILVTRNLLVLAASCFLVVAALIGSEPVADETRRQIFWIGCIAAILAYLFGILMQRRHARRMRAERDEQIALLEQLRSKYEAEVRWRMAERKPPPPADKGKPSAMVPSAGAGDNREQPAAP